MTSVSVKEAKNTFTALLHKVENGEPVEILRHGKSVAVISSKEYFESHTKESSFEERLMAWRNKYSALFTNEEIDEIFNIERKPRNIIRHEDDLGGLE